MKRSIHALISVMTLLVALIVPIGSASAACGSWYPTVGSIKAAVERPGSFNVFTVRVNFRFSSGQVAALRCTGSSAFEVDAINYDGGLVGGLRSWSSNLPGKYLDTEASDQPSARVLSVGSQSATAIQANVDYFTEIRLTEVKTTGAASTNMVLNFQRGHWASTVNPAEAPACAYGRRTDPAWCVFADESVLMLDKGLARTRVDLNRGYNAYDVRAWGTVRKSSLGSGGRLNIGERLVSPNGATELVMQSDGNLVEYSGGRVIWATMTSRPGTIMVMQGDGNLVLVAPGNLAVWSSGTYRFSNAAAVLQDDRNFVIYAPGSQAVWANWGNAK